jgi:hypothetical protein
MCLGGWGPEHIILQGKVLRQEAKYRLWASLVSGATLLPDGKVSHQGMWGTDGSSSLRK